MSHIHGRHHSALARGLMITVLITGTLVSQTRSQAAASAGLRPQGDSVVQRANAARKHRGCKALETAAPLSASAQGHADDMSAHDYFSHTSRDGRTWDERIRDAGYPEPGGENIAYGFDTAADVHDAWMNSAGHRRNILDCRFRRIGVGHAAEGGFWVQDFGY